MKAGSIKKYLLLVLLLAIAAVVASGLSIGKRRHPASAVKDSDQSVTTDSAFIVSEMKDCYTKGAPQCYQDAAAHFMEKFNLVKVLALLKSNEQQPEVFSRCHEVTHYLGRLEYQKTKSVPQVFSECDSTCHGGCYHGVIEEYFKESGDGTIGLSDVDISNKIRTVCGKQETYAAPRIYSECVHGIGHAMMYINNQEVPQSLNFCDSLSTQSDRETCYGGVFMENSSSSTNLDHPTQYLKADDPLYPCDVLESRYLKICYEYQSSYFAELSTWDWNKTAQLCLRVPADYQAGCFNIIGSNQVGYTEDQAVMKNDCYLMPTSDFVSNCVAGVISAFGGRYVGDMGKMVSFCSLLAETEKQSCYNSIGNVVESWSTDPTYQKHHCEEIENDQYASWCENPVSQQQILTN